MTDVQTQHDHDAGPDEGPIRTPRQLILAVLYSFAVPIIVILLLVLYVTSHQRPAAGSSTMSAEGVAERIRPVGMVQVKDASDSSTLKSGEYVFGAQCSACHAAGLVGAPKFGDAGSWAPRIRTGYAVLLNSALHGKGQMGPQGGGEFTDLEVGRAVVYMANHAGARFDEPMPAAVDPGAANANTDAAAASTASGLGPVGAAIASASAAASSLAGVAPGVAASAAATAARAAVIASAATATGATNVAAAGAVPALYTQLCQTCHASGVAGAPKPGDKAAWGPRLAQGGIDALTASAIKGKGAMPPRGGSTASDADLRNVVSYMATSGN